MGTHEGSFALGAMWLVSSLAMASCSETHARQVPAASTAEPGLGDGGTMPDTSELRIQSEPSCMVSEAYVDSLYAACPGPSFDGAACQATDPACITYRRESGPSRPFGVCSATCWPSESGSGLAWSIECFGTCNRECAEPPAEAPVVRLDVSDCAARPVVPCMDSVLVQDQLDSMLRSLVSEHSVPLFELPEESLVVHFENGCPSSFHAQRLHEIPMVQQALSGPLRKVRWACAMPLECGEVLGPSTIATE